MRSLLGLAPLLFCQLAIAQSVVAVYPAPASVEKGTSKQFSSYVAVSPNTITWSVNGMPGGDSIYGTITQNGLYNAPAVIPPNNVITVRATSVAKPTVFGDSKVTLTQPVPSLWSTSPNTFTTGMGRKMSLNGSNFIPQSIVIVNGVAWATTYINSTSLYGQGDLPAAGTFKVTVDQPGPGAVSSPSVNITVTVPPITVTIAPNAVNSILSGATQFAATVNGTSNTAVTWTATAGAISATGLYTAPGVMPANPVVTIRATSVADATKFGQATVTFSPPQPVSVTISPGTVTLALSATSQFAASVAGTNNQAVTWSATAGTISATGLYTAPTVMPGSSSITIKATSVADSTKFGQAIVTLKVTGGGGTPGNNGATLAVGRFLEQAAFGPTPAELGVVQSKGVNTWLNDQFAMPETPITIPVQMGSVQSLTLNRMTTAPDQLRQKMAWALGQIIVISMNKNIYPNEYVPYQQILSRNAFGNYRTLLSDIATSPQMGKYLDIANSNKPTGAGGANENFAREVMQLFTIGLNKLNIDGSTQLVNGQPVPTYNQADIRQIALALTGWTYPTAAGAQPKPNNWEDFSQPKMETRQANHDTSAKTLINGCTLPAGQTVQQDMDGVLDCLFNHANTGPFVATRLIRLLVTSNPSSAFIQRIATVFNNNGVGVRGDLKAVFQAILTDSEARQDVATVNSGRLKDPIYFFVSFVRTMNGTIIPTTGIPYTFVAMGEAVGTPASVFNYFSPLYRLPFNPALFGPEFQIYTATESVVAANMLHQIINQPNGDPYIDLSPFVAVSSNTALLLDLVDQKLFYGRMPLPMRTSLATAIDASYDSAQRVQTALYLAGLTGQYQTQY